MLNAWRWLRTRHVTRSARDGHRSSARSNPTLESLETREVPVTDILAGFDAVDQVSFVPPDTHAAVGFTTIVEGTNGDLAIFRKDGTVLDRANSSDFYAGTSENLFGPFDPWVIWDTYSQRYFIVYGEVDFTNNDNSNYLVAVSTSSDPDDLDTAPGDTDTDWNFYRIANQQTIDGNLSWSDYWKVSADDDSLYITGNYFGFTAGFQDSVVMRLDKAPLVAGGPAPAPVNVRATGSFTLQPALSIGRPVGDPERFVAASGGGIQVWEMNDANTVTLVTTIPAAIPFVGDAPIPGGNTIDTLSNRLINAVWRNNSIWTAHTVAGSDGEAVVQWYEIDTTGGVYTLVQSGQIDPGPGLHSLIPAIAVDDAGNAAITYTVAGAGQMPQMVIAGRQAADAPGTFRPGVVVRDSDAATYDGGRWGDYASVVVDPADDSVFWAAHEFALQTSQWGTFISGFRVGETVAAINLVPLATTNVVGSTSSVTATVLDGGGNPLANRDVTFTIAGANNLVGTARTDANGEATFSYTGVIAGIDVINARINAVVSNDVTKTWIPASSLQGQVFVDNANPNDGIRSPVEQGIAGVTMLLTGTDILGNVISVTTLTDVFGLYRFDRLAAGIYSITQVQPGAYIDGVAVVGAAGGSVDNTNTISGITLPAGTDSVEYNFTERGLLAGFVSKRQLLASTASTLLPGTFDGRAAPAPADDETPANDDPLPIDGDGTGNPPVNVPGRGSANGDENTPRTPTLPTLPPPPRRAPPKGVPLIVVDPPVSTPIDEGSSEAPPASIVEGDTVPGAGADDIVDAITPPVEGDATLPTDPGAGAGDTVASDDAGSLTDPGLDPDLILS